MKKFSAASFMEIIRKNKFPIAAFSLLLMIAAAFSIPFCEKEITALEKKWRSVCRLNEVWGFSDPKAMTEGQPRDLTRYDMQVDLTRLRRRRAEILFCDKYSFIMTGTSEPSGVYYKDGRGRETYVSKAEYPRTSMHTPADPQRFENYRLRFKCDLVAKTVLVYMNGKFMEKIPLGPEPVNDSFGLAFPPERKEVILNNLEISGPKGRVLYSVNFSPLYFYKFLSQTFLSLGVLIFFFLGCSEKRFFRRALFFAFPLIFLEVFLRAAYPHDPALDIDRLKPKWQFEISTNFFGAFNDPKELTIRSYFPGDPRRTYPIANPEHALRILCVGSSPLVVGAPSPGQAFPALLEKKLNTWNKKKNRVIPVVVLMIQCFNGAEPNIFLKEILNKMDPDLILYYGNLASPKEAEYKDRFERDYALYQRAKRVVEKNSDWVKSDRLLYAALEFKEPVKGIVYLYDFLCKSYLFMAAENIRKRFLEAWRPDDRKTSVENLDSFFKEVLASCKKRGIKVVFIPQLDFLKGSNDKRTEIFLANLRREHPEISSLSLEGILGKNKTFLLAQDSNHLLSEYGHEIIAEEIFRQLVEIDKKGSLHIRG